MLSAPPNTFQVNYLNRPKSRMVSSLVVGIAVFGSVLPMFVALIMCAWCKKGPAPGNRPTSSSHFEDSLRVPLAYNSTSVRLHPCMISRVFLGFRVQFAVFNVL